MEIKGYQGESQPLECMGRLLLLISDRNMSDSKLHIKLKLTFKSRGEILLVPLATLSSQKKESFHC